MKLNKLLWSWTRCYRIEHVAIEINLTVFNLGTVSKIPWSQWSEILFTSPLTPSPPLRSEIPSYFWLHSMMVNTMQSLSDFIEKLYEANFFWKSEIVTMKSPTPSPPPPPPPSEKYFTSLASRYFWDGPLLKAVPLIWPLEVTALGKMAKSWKIQTLKGLVNLGLPPQQQPGSYRGGGDDDD